MLSPQREAQLLAAHRKGAAGAVAELLSAYQRRVYAICARMLRDEQEARDLAQESLIHVLEGLESYDGRCRLSTWIIQVTINCCLSYLRKERLRRHAPLEGPAWRAGRAPASAEPSPARRVEQQEAAAAVRRALGALDPPMRAILILRDMQDLEYQQIAEVLDVPVGTVKSRLFRARAALRAAVETESVG
jgi:RNA polymerase sigma-70 factor (ECF subfamily)